MPRPAFPSAAYLEEFRAALRLFLGAGGLSRAFDSAGRLRPDAVVLAARWEVAGVSAADCAGWLAGPGACGIPFGVIPDPPAWLLPGAARPFARAAFWRGAC